jgi:predicted transcriptional regulator
MSRTPIHTPEQLQGLISIYGSAYAAAKALRITPQAFYDQMHSKGMKPKGYALLEGEPKGKMKKRIWLQDLIIKHHNNLSAVAKELGISRTAVVSRMGSYRIKSKYPTKLERQCEFTKVFMNKKGKVKDIARVLKVTPAAVYERVHRYMLVT